MYSESGIVVLMGDMNVNLLPNAVQGNATGRKLHFLNFLQDSNMTSLTTLGLCTGARSSFVSYDNSAESLIDHIIFPAEKLLYVNALMFQGIDRFFVNYGYQHTIYGLPGAEGIITLIGRMQRLSLCLYIDNI